MNYLRGLPSSEATSLLATGYGVESLKNHDQCCRISRRDREIYVRLEVSMEDYDWQEQLEFGAAGWRPLGAPLPMRDSRKSTGQSIVRPTELAAPEARWIYFH